jgi:hypothetical protein
MRAHSALTALAASPLLLGLGAPTYAAQRDVPPADNLTRQLTTTDFRQP